MDGDRDQPEPGRWRTFYAVVLIELAALIGLFYLLTWWAS
jgi:hypothetical protein